MRGKKLEKKLIAFSTKLTQETIDLINALNFVTNGSGQREVIENALESYAENNPEDYKKAKEYLEFKKAMVSENE